jgi:hypothetical protein
MALWSVSRFAFLVAMWGLPPPWLKVKWNPCQEEGYRPPAFAHRESVPQKVLTWPDFLHYDKYMADIVSTDKQIAAIGALAMRASIVQEFRSLEPTEAEA